MSIGKFLRLGGFLAVVCGAAPVSAQAGSETGSVEGRSQLQLQLALLDYGKISGTIRSGFSGEGADTTTKGATYGLASRVGFGLGYGLSEHALLFVFGGFAIQKSSYEAALADGSLEESGTRTAVVQFIPSLRYEGGDDDSRFYVGGAVGFERSKLHTEGSAVDISSRAMLMGTQIGIHCFLHERLSLEPGLEIYFTKRSSDLEDAESQDEVHETGRGVRVLITLGISAWFGKSSLEPSVNVSQEPKTAPATLEPETSADNTHFVTTTIDDLRLELRGAPQRLGTALTLAVRTHGAEDPPRCEAALLSDDPAEALDFSWRLEDADERGPLQVGVASIRLRQLERWLARNPTMRVCKRLYRVPSDVRAQLEAALSRFKDEAVAAGTREPESGSTSSLADSPSHEAQRTPAEGKSAEPAGRQGSPAR